MKNISVVLLIFAVSSSVLAQNLITTINTKNRVEAYNFKYNKSDGCYIYSDYDTTSKKAVIITPKGTSKEYDNSMLYAALFDGAGNVYTPVYNNITDTTYRYFMLKNNEEIISFDYIYDGWDILNGVIYMFVKENEKFMIASYDTRSGSISKGKPYDEIYLISYTGNYFEEEPQGKIGFTKGGLPYYMAAENNMKFLVVGTAEQKHYADIDSYSFRTDNNDGICYIAKSKGTLYYNKGNTFVVQGNKEYKSYDYVYGPILFDKMNNPVYVANDSLGEYTYRTRVMSGNIEGETFEGNIYDYKITPSGKIAYIVSTQRPGLKKDEFIYESYLVNNGEEGEYFSSVSNLTFNDNGVPSYIASDKNNKYFVVKADKKMSEKYDNILNYSYLGDGSLEYEAVNYGNYDKHIPDKYFVHVSGKNYGPFESISVADYSTGKYVLTDNNKYAFITGRLTDRDKYLYKYKVITGEWESIEHDYIEDGRIINGKIMFVSSDLFDKENYISRYALYIDNKTAADDYSSLVFFDADKLSGKASYIGCKGNSFYLLEY